MLLIADTQTPEGRRVVEELGDDLPESPNSVRVAAVAYADMRRLMKDGGRKALARMADVPESVPVVVYSGAQALVGALSRTV